MSQDKCVKCDTPVQAGGTWGHCDNCWDDNMMVDRSQRPDTIILPTKFDEDEFFNDTAEVIIALEQALEEKLGSTKWEWEWRSVIGEDYTEDPIWSLQLYVETKGKEYN